MIVKLWLFKIIYKIIKSEYSKSVLVPKKKV